MPAAPSVRSAVRRVEELDERSLLSAGPGASDGPPPWAAAHGYRAEHVSPPVAGEPGEPGETAGSEPLSPESSHAPPGQTDDGTSSGPGRGDETDPGDVTDGGSVQPSVENAEGSTPPEPDVTAPVSVTVAASSTATTENELTSRAFWFPPEASTLGSGGSWAPAAGHDSYGSPPLAAADPGIRLAGGSVSRESSVMVGVGGAAADAPAGQAASGATPADGAPLVYPVTPEDIANLPFGPAVDAQLGFGAIEAGILNRFAPPEVLAEAAQAVELLAVRLEEEAAGSGWESWAAAAGLAVVAGEVARRQLRRRPTGRPVPPAWSRGGLDGF